MSAQPPSAGPDDGVELQPLLIELLSAQRERDPSVSKAQRRLEGREIRVRAEREELRAFLERLLAAGAEATSSWELSLIALELEAAHALRPGPGAGRWLRLGLRRDGAEAGAATHFDQLGIPFLENWEAHANALAALCLHHHFGVHATTQIYIPALDPPHGRRPLPQPSRILFVDDEAMILEVHRQSIESLGYEVVEREDPAAALELFVAHPDAFDCVLSDRSMPGMSGDELARRLRTLRPRIPVVLSTGYAPVADDVDGALEGVEYLAKPFTMEELASCLARSCERSRTN